MPQDKNSSNNISISQKYLEKILKLQQGQDDTHQQETSILKAHLEMMNILLAKLASSTGTNINIAEGQKSIPYSHSSTVGTVQLTKPTNPDDYTEIINVYSENGSRPVQHMTIISDGPGAIYFIVAHSKMDFSSQEIILGVNDQRELFNVYEVRLRVTQPLTSYRLIEGVFRTGSFAPSTVANITIQPSIQPNEIFKRFILVFDNQVNITIQQPIVQNFTANFGFPGILPPLPPGQTAAFVDADTGIPSPFTIPEGFILESFGFFSNFNTDNTVRGYFELDPIFFPDTFFLTQVFPTSNRGQLLNATAGNLSTFSSQIIDPFGAPIGGRRILSTITNDDPFNHMIGSIFFAGILRRLS